MSTEKLLKKGDAVTHTKFGKGVIVSIDTVEVPSDDDSTMYTVKMTNGVLRHFKSYELK